MLDTMVETRIIKDAVRLACRSPSLYNSQPWLWVADSGRLELFVDPSRIMHTDRSGREALISCGAVLDHLRVAMAAAGWKAIVNRFPNPSRPYHLATVEFTPMQYVTDDDRRRADAILTRRTDRLPFRPPLKWDSFEPALRSRMEASPVRLDVLPDALRPRLAAASRLTESLRLYDSAYQTELQWWTAPYEVSEGIPYSSLVSAAEGDRVGVNRVFPVTHNAERRTEICEDYAKLLMLSTEGDSRADALSCGEALSAVLLESTTAGLATCAVTHLTELSVSRELLAAEAGHADLPQVLIRIGIAPMLSGIPPVTPRRPLAEVLRIKDSAADCSMDAAGGNPSEPATASN